MSKLHTKTFGLALRQCRIRSKLSQNALAGRAGVNASYINRLESGERGAPTDGVVTCLATAMGLSSEETDSLLFAAGYLPLSLKELGPYDTTIQAVLRVLGNTKLSNESQADYRAVIECLCYHWDHVGVANTATRSWDDAPIPMTLPDTARKSINRAMSWLPRKRRGL